VIKFPDAYPLQWPSGWDRTPPHKRGDSNYKVGEAQARDEMYEAIRKLGGAVPIVSSNLRVRRDGVPYTDQGLPGDPGVAVYWVRQGRQEVMACDRWRQPRENVRAIYHAIEALRAMERSGATQVMERAFSAFQLPEEASLKHWRSVFDLEPSFHPSPRHLRAIAKALMAKYHPDKPGGDIEKFREVEKALDEAIRDVS
jgi:hypothetical protein